MTPSRGTRAGRRSIGAVEEIFYRRTDLYRRKTEYATALLVTDSYPDQLSIYRSSIRQPAVRTLRPRHPEDQFQCVTVQKNRRISQGRKMNFVF